MRHLIPGTLMSMLVWLVAGFTAPQPAGHAAWAQTVVFSGFWSRVTPR